MFRPILSRSGQVRRLCHLSSSLTNDSGVLTISFNNAKKKNALTIDIYSALVDRLNKAAVDKACRLVVLTGSGDYYSSGKDIVHFANVVHPGGKLDETGGMAMRQAVERIQNAFVSFPKPLIAVVNGPAFGIAVTTLLLCDAVLAVESAKFCAPFTSIGFGPEGCSSWTFPLMLGPLKATELLLFGRTLNAAEAQRCGLVSRVFPTSTFKANVDAYVKDVADMPNDTLLTAKALLRGRAALMDKNKLQAAGVGELDSLQKKFGSTDCLSAIAKFMASKQPKKS